MIPRLAEGAVHPFENWDIPALIDEQADSLGNKPFLIWRPFEGDAKTWSYQGFAHDSLKLAAGLYTHGINAGDFVLIHMDNCPEFLLAWAACARLGAIAVTTNTKSAGEELAYFAEHSNAVAALTQPKYAELVEANCQKLSWIAVTDSNGDGSPEGAPSDQCQRFEQLYKEADQFEARAADPTLPLSIMYTSGTTSRPKGVIWTHANGLASARALAFHEELTVDDTHLVFLPLFHMNAMSNSILATLWAGATAVLQPRFSSSRFWQVALDYKCTWTSLIPFCINALRAQEVPDHYFKYWGVGAVIPTIDEHFNVKSVGWWGMTESTAVGIVSQLHHHYMPMSLGRPSPFYEIAIVSDDGRKVAPGETGDLRIRGIAGVTLFAGYLHNDEATKSSFDEDGFFITGDRCTLLADGSIKFADRSKDMLKVGGENVAASEIEAAIMQTGRAKEVAVVAKRDHMLDQVPVAFVIPSSGDTEDTQTIEAIKTACSQSLADFKRPREVRLVEELPRSTLNKIAKNVLRDMLDSEDA